MRGQGLGERLLRALFDAARPLYPALSLSVRQENPARRLYERAGFVVTHTITNRVGGVSLVMRADLLDNLAGRLRLVTPGEAWRPQFQALAREYLLAGEGRYTRALDDFDGFLALLRRYAADDDLPAGHVPALTFWALAGETLVGALRLRHGRMVPWVETYGGHIGYDVRPAARGRGCATRMLALGLNEARARGMRRLRVTCALGNRASARVIEANGGVLEDHALDESEDVTYARYSIVVPDGAIPAGA
jgi:predicted acetyltransferase